MAKSFEDHLAKGKRRIKSANNPIPASELARYVDVLIARAKASKPEAKSALLAVGGDLTAMMYAIECDYCKQEARLVGGMEIYPGRKDLYGKLFWLCIPCNAYVGCHPGTAVPLGRLADKELRKSKVDAHAAFDPVWQSKASQSRGAAYRWLASQLGISTDDCHIGMLDVDQCRRVVEVCNAFRRSHGQAQA